MQEIKTYRDFCENCTHFPTCTYPKINGRPIYYCSEHEAWKECLGEVSLALLKSKKGAPPSGRPGSENPEKEKENVELRGLCINCENRKDCTFPKPPGGVWHCEEYV